MNFRSVKNTYHKGQAVAANVLYGFPAGRMTIIGVTGTDGKTTTASMIYHILSASGKKTALISTVAAIIDGAVYDTGFHVTTPSAFSLRRYLKLAKKKGVTYLVLEVTSHGLDQARVHGIPFAISVITNVTHEHLDYHRTYEAYVLAKTRLLRASKTALLNRDDSSFPLIEQALKDYRYQGKLLTYGAEDATFALKNTSFTLQIPGQFNRYNALAAWAVCQELDIAQATIQEALGTFVLPVGRGEIVYRKDFSVMIDFAHTPNAIEQILRTIHDEIKPTGRIIHVFGSAGKRDSTKRPLMGRASSRFADVIILTAEDPRQERVENINTEICDGIPSEILVKRSVTVEEITDRQNAIDHAIMMAKKGDFVVITGKGHERSMNLGHSETPWSDHEAVEKAIAKRGINA